MALTYEPIATTTLGSAAANITFSSISSAYTDLRLVVANFTLSSTFNLFVQFNNDTNANYSWTRLQGDGATASSARSTNSGDGILVGIASITYPGFCTVDIFSYTGSTNKTTLGTSSSDRNGGGHVNRNVGLWRNTSAISTVVFSNNGGDNFPSGTTATLYGIKSA